MSKKSPLSLYLIGLVLVVVGCFLPLKASGWGFSGTNIIDVITADGSSDLKIAGILALAGAVAGIVFSFVALKGIPAKLISLIVSVAGGIYLVISFLNINPWAKKLIRGLNSMFDMHPSYGFYLIIAGWVLALVGYFMNKD